MPHWADSRTSAYRNVTKALGLVDDILSYVKDSAGKPSTKERALFAAAVAFTYGIWEHFVEQLAIELAHNVGSEVAAERVPEQMRRLFEKKSAWDLAVTPGWRALWIEHVKVQAIGDDDERYGMNTAKSGQVRQLLSLAGVTDPYCEVAAEHVPEHLPEVEHTVVNAIDRLVELRGEIVHTGKVPDTLRKNHVLAWQRFVAAVADGIDKASRAQCKLLLK